MTAADLIPIVSVLSLGLLVFHKAQDRIERRDRAMLLVSFLGHVISAFGQVWITRDFYSGTGDMSGYERRGTALAALMRDDFLYWAPEVAKLIFLQHPNLPVDIFGAGSATGAMAGITGFLFLVLNDSLHAACLFVSILSFQARFTLFSVLRFQVSAHLRRRLLFAVMLIPSVVFWTSGLTKETFAVIGLGALLNGAWLMTQGTPRGGLMRAILGAALVAMAKPYILFPAILALATWFYWQRATAGGRDLKVRPAYALAAVLFSATIIVMLGRLFPEYAVSNFIDEATRYQRIGRHIEGGSNYSLGDVDGSRGALGQLLFAPLALATALFRPFIFEANNPLVLLNALETTAILIAVLRALVLRPLSATWRYLRASPLLVACFVFTLAMGTAVGLATTNLGTLSRYRAPMFPFFSTLVMVLSARTPTYRRKSGPANLRHRSSGGRRLPHQPRAEQVAPQ